MFTKTNRLVDQSLAQLNPSWHCLQLCYSMNKFVCIFFQPQKLNRGQPKVSILKLEPLFHLDHLLLTMMPTKQQFPVANTQYHNI